MIHIGVICSPRKTLTVTLMTGESIKIYRDRKYYLASHDELVDIETGEWYVLNAEFDNKFSHRNFKISRENIIHNVHNISEFMYDFVNSNKGLTSSELYELMKLTIDDINIDEFTKILMSDLRFETKLTWHVRRENPHLFSLSPMQRYTETFEREEQ